MGLGAGRAPFYQAIITIKNMIDVPKYIGREVQKVTEKRGKATLLVGMACAALVDIPFKEAMEKMKNNPIELIGDILNRLEKKSVRDKAQFVEEVVSKEKELSSHFAHGYVAGRLLMLKLKNLHGDAAEKKMLEGVKKAMDEIGGNTSWDEKYKMAYACMVANAFHSAGVPLLSGYKTIGVWAAGVCGFYENKEARDTVFFALGIPPHISGAIQAARKIIKGEITLKEVNAALDEVVEIKNKEGKKVRIKKKEEAAALILGMGFSQNGETQKHPDEACEAVLLLFAALRTLAENGIIK